MRITQPVKITAILLCLSALQIGHAQTIDEMDKLAYQAHPSSSHHLKRPKVRPVSHESDTWVKMPSPPPETMIKKRPTVQYVTPLDFHLSEIPVQLGVYASSPGKAQHINIDTLIGNQYTTTSKQSENVLVGLGYYIPGLEQAYFKLSYGINAFYLAPNRVNGDIIQEDLFTNLSYQYQVQHIPVYAVVKAAWNQNNHAITFDLGLGPNFMQVSQYHETPLNDYTLPDNAFTSRTNTTFSVTAGVGLRVNHAFGKVPVECGYRFYALGEGQLTMNNSQLLNAVQTGNVYANALVCSVIM
jgi:hypothetical protein